MNELFIKFFASGELFQKQLRTRIVHIYVLLITSGPYLFDV